MTRIIAPKYMLRATIEPARDKSGKPIVATWAEAHKMTIEQPRHRLLDRCVADEAHWRTLNPNDRGALDTVLHAHGIMARELSITPPEGGFNRGQVIDLPDGMQLHPSIIPEAAFGKSRVALLADFAPNGTRVTTALNLPPSGGFGRVNPETGLPEISAAGFPEAEKRWPFYKPDYVAPVARAGDDFGNNGRDVVLSNRPSNGLGVASVRRDIVRLNDAGVWQEDLARGVSIEQVRALARNETTGPGSDALKAVLETMNQHERAALVQQVMFELAMA